MSARPRTECRDQTRRGTQKRVHTTGTRRIFIKRQTTMQQALLYNEGVVVGDYSMCLQKNCIRRKTKFIKHEVTWKNTALDRSS